MKALRLLLAGLLCASVHAATSDALFPIGGTNFPGLAGNVVFNGEHFVTPTVQGNGAIDLVFLNTNGVAISNSFLNVTGSSPRIAFDGANYLLGWLDANSTLLCARVTNNATDPSFSIATNVAAETLSLRAGSGSPLALWQSAGSNSTVFARRLTITGAPLADAFAIAPSASPQRHPSVNNEGTNCLVVWMEQNVSSNDWRVLARFVNEAGPVGSTIEVSETNSLRAWPTACSFGSNYLVAWSWDEGPLWYYDYARTYVWTNGWFPMIHGRMLSFVGVPQSNAFPIARFILTNTDPAVAFGDGRHLVTWVNRNNDYNDHGFSRAQPLALDGARREYPIPGVQGNFTKAQMTFGNGRFCVLYPDADDGTFSMMFGHEVMAPLMLVNLRRINTSMAVQSSRSRWESFETSTNLVDWRFQDAILEQIPNTFAGERQLFVRLFDRKWQCVEQMRSLDWAKHQWAVDTKKANTDTPTEFDIFGPTKYLRDKPRCPHNGYYWLNSIQTKPTCSIGFNHTF